MRELQAGVWHWATRHPEWTSSEPWGPEVSSYAIDDGERMLLFDPLAGSLDLLDHEAPASRPLQCELGLTTRKLLKPLAHRFSRRGHDPAPPNLTRLAVERPVRDLPSMHIQCDYDRHRDLLELRRHERHRVRNTLEPRRSHYMSSLWNGKGRVDATSLC